MAQQFVGRVRGHFSSADKYEMLEENLLSYEEVQKIFEGQSPQFSVLFSTGGSGYFAYCVIAPHLIRDEHRISASIKAENAMAELRKYLHENEKSKRKKILVVDDSDIMRHALKELLEKDYEVSMANSGVSAIRCITLDRPDLVLLDYEMPVCDGSQVLEMIRSEEEFKELPVVFLTGRMDKSSVQKVIALNPKGYLLKTMGAEEIKKCVDGFME